MWEARIFTLYPEIFPGPLQKGLYGKALSNKIWSLDVINIRDSAEDKHKTVDDTPFGGGSGMIIKPDILMKNSLEKLTGRKIIFTNANKSHVDNVLNRLNINNIFDSVYDITDADYYPKPDIRSYKSFVKKYNIDATKTIMFDDIARNLVPASKLGFTTVWIDIGKENYSDDIKNSKKYLNYETTSLPLWLNSIIKES